MKSLSRARIAAGAAAAALLLAASSSAAQGLPLDRFDPAPAGDRMFGVPSPFVAGHLTPHVGLLLDYAHNPLVLHNVGTDKDVGSVLSSQMFLHINASFALWNRLAINLDLPVALLQHGNGGAAFPSPDKAQIGDLRAGLRVRLFGEYHDPFQIGVGGYVYFPTAPSGGYVGTGKVRGAAQLLLGGRIADRVVWSAAVGPQIQGQTAFGGVTEGTQLNAGLGFGVLLGDDRHFQIGPEAYSSFTLVKDAAATADELRRKANVEVLLDARYRVIDDLELSLGAGPGLTAGLGTPDFRGVFMIAYTPEQKKPRLDRDGDGIFDDVDACPDVKGVASEDPKKNGCPPAPPSDRDGDGIADDVDACPDVKGVPSDDPKKHGCPPPPLDTDGDGIPDAQDACPTVKGVPSEDPTKNGCPPDRDGDGIVDAEDACPDVKGPRREDPKETGCPDTDGDGIIDPIDACPNEPGPRDPDPKKNGCPTVHVTDQEIVILEQVQFDTGKATIKKVSDALLDKVAKVFKEHGEIAKVEVQGHTDNVGLAPQNKTLSQSRADAVLKALVKRGIDKKRLVAKGYGQDVPIADNATDAGRQENRRVQFKIVDKKGKTDVVETKPKPVEKKPKGKR